MERRVEVRAPGAGHLEVVVAGAGGTTPERVFPMRPLPRRAAEPGVPGGPTHRTVVRAADGDHYWLVADGDGPLVDPSAADVVITPHGPVGVLRGPWPAARREYRRTARRRAPVVYELHVRGFARTFAGVAERMAYLADLGVEVIEVMPVHPFDPRTNYWGYMPIVWGAVHRPYAVSDDAAQEFAAMITAAHEHGIEVWLDVVFNHTGESDPAQPTWTLRGLDESAYLRRDDGTYVDDAGCGNTVDVSHPGVRYLVFEALDRFARLGLDGFRFDLASVLTRDGGAFVREIGDWAARRDVRLVAEPWDLVAYQVGHGFPDQRWSQWNDRFRDDVRGFLRGEPGRVEAMVARVNGSPDLFPDDAARSVNFITAHDGLTLHDLMSVTDERHRSWDTGHALRVQMMCNAFAILLLSAGTPMFVMGDEFARTQSGHDNPYDIDSPLTWVDWGRLDEWRDLHAAVRRLIALRHRAGDALAHGGVRTYGCCGAPDLGHESRTIAWATDSLYVAANMWWEPVPFTIQQPGRWRAEMATDGSTPSDRDLAAGDTVTVPARTVCVWSNEEAPA